MTTEHVFPQSMQAGELAVAEGGLTLRDYFIAHAPSEPQAWFEGQMPPPPRPRMLRPSYLSPEDREVLASWDDGIIKACDIAPSLARNLAEDWERHRKEVYDWEREKTKQRYIQWPAAWADAMLQARKQSTTATN